MRGRGRGETKSVTFTKAKELITSFQQRLKTIGTPPKIINPTSLQEVETLSHIQNIEGRQRKRTRKKIKLFLFRKSRRKRQSTE